MANDVDARCTTQFINCLERRYNSPYFLYTMLCIWRGLKTRIMSLLYKPKEEQTISVDVKTFPDGKIELLFHSDCGKFGTDEILDGYKLTAERLLNILQERDDYSEDEL